MLTRRLVLAAAAATAASAAIPAGAAIVAPAPAATPLLPAWIVGTEGEFDYQMVRAATQAEALAIRVTEVSGHKTCTCDTGEAGVCDYCYYDGHFDAIRVEDFDTLAEPTGGDWIRAGYGYHCSRCGYETFPETGGIALGDEAICEECMTLADWDIVDPQRAAELRADEAELDNV